MWLRTLVWRNVYPNDILSFLAQVREEWKTPTNVSLIRETEPLLQFDGYKVHVVLDFNMKEHTPEHYFLFS